VELDRFK